MGQIYQKPKCRNSHDNVTFKICPYSVFTAMTNSDNLTKNKSTASDVDHNRGRAGQGGRYYQMPFSHWLSFITGMEDFNFRWL
jgi:hypothetical protein